MGKITTIRDVAKAAGVSSCTASYALRGNPKVSVATTRKVREVADRLGYRLATPVSQWMRSLRMKSETFVGEKIYFVVNETTWKRNRFVRSYFKGGQERAESHGYDLEPLVYDHREMNGRRLSEIIWARGIRGLVLGPLRPEVPAPELQWEKFAVAGFNLDDGAEMNRAANDYFASAAEAMRRAYDRGYRRPGLAVYRGLDESYAHSITAAYLRHGQLLDKTATVPPLLLDESTFNLESFAKWFREYKPDCVIGVHCLLPFMRSLKLKIPAKVGYVSLNQTAASEPCAGLAHDFELMGATAVDLVLSQLNRNAVGPVERAMTVLLKPRWQDGPTLR
ncbi:MAG: hypothetical protein SynsKO_32010 [Synoicihabitans sp.]